MNLENNAIARIADQATSFAPLPKIGATYARRWGEVTEAALFWLLIAGLAWVPFWNGSNELAAWGINAVLFAGITLTYEISLLIRGGRHPVGIRNITLPAALFLVVLIWIYVQTIAWPHSWLNHPIWAMPRPRRRCDGRRRSRRPRGGGLVASAPPRFGVAGAVVSVATFVPANKS